MRNAASLLSIILLARAAMASDVGPVAAAPEVGSERPSLLLPEAGDAREGTFWFSPQSWSTADLRHATLRLGFLLEGPLTPSLLEPETESVPAPGRATQQRVRAAPRIRGLGASGGAKGILGLFRPRVTVRVTPRLAVAPPAPDRRPPAVSAAH